MAQFAAEAGWVTEARRATIEQLVGVVMQSEAMTSSIVNGETVEAALQVRLAKTRASLMRELGIGQGKPASGQKIEAGGLDLEFSNDNDDGAAPRSAIG